MTRIIITLLGLIVGLLSNAQELSTTLDATSEGITISVTIPNISGDKGKVYFALFDSVEKFNQREALQSAQGEIEDGKTKVFFNEVPEGIYAITCYHDANDNKQMDFDGYMPIEDYGSSNNPTNFGPPQFEASKFEVSTKDLDLEIRF